MAAIETLRTKRGSRIESYEKSFLIDGQVVFIAAPISNNALRQLKNAIQTLEQRAYQDGRESVQNAVKSALEIKEYHGWQR